ncbi:MAG: prolyl oligopeptidase family serine peptidase [Clostridia bacterium]|nr:prolyl oligopeptidase family serine peptidase [Clostridia bacterium]
MEKIINYENLSYFAYSNDKEIKGEIRGVVLNFFGLGGMAMYPEGTNDGHFFAEKNVLYITPYTNPWGWMNKDEVNLTDEILDVLFDKYNLSNDIPIVSTGGSMGGLACIVYTKYAKRTPIGCVANCPVCDLPYHFTERVDLPRTLYSAFYSYDCDLDTALKSASPLHLIDTLPQKTEYIIFHCDKDRAVNINMHSEKFVDALAKTRDVRFYIAKGRDHCDLGERLSEKYREEILGFIS